jgi:hypothetical protein
LCRLHDIAAGADKVVRQNGEANTGHNRKNPFNGLNGSAL